MPGTGPMQLGQRGCQGRLGGCQGSLGDSRFFSLLVYLRERAESSAGGFREDSRTEAPVPCCLLSLCWTPNFCLKTFFSHSLERDEGECPELSLVRGRAV